ncbi:hypothetical protein T4E_5352 [Trichinella pseudospiralis]|uniref:Transposon Ty3-I Gag-Pol polyprotein n=1 Tax=Trichinella pseudospiralis TaxID=6337 RepID=A0A0V0XF91_TRIPS|nr:hypothetical protein T4E_5352 [Trichinella pseudospiralis]
MMQTRVKEPAFGPWCSPVVLVWKKDGSLRFCVDHRRMSSVEVAEREREKTAFSPSMGLLRFWVILFGLWNAPTTFQRNGKSTEGPNRTEEEHLECLKGVLSRLQSVELNIKHEKWQLMLSAKLLLTGCSKVVHAPVREGGTAILGASLLLQVVCPEFRRRGNCVARLYKERCEVTLGAEGGRGVHLLEGCAGERQRRRLQSNAASTRGRRPTSGDRVRLTLAFTGCSGLLRDANEDASPSLGYSPLLMISVRQETRGAQFNVIHHTVKKYNNAYALSRLVHVLFLAFDSTSFIERCQKKRLECVRVQESMEKETWPQLAPEGSLWIRSP